MVLCDVRTFLCLKKAATNPNALHLQNYEIKPLVQLSLDIYREKMGYNKYIIVFMTKRANFAQDILRQ